MGYWRSLHLFDDKKFYADVVPTLKGEKGDLTADCLEFLKFHITGSTSRLSQHELEKLVRDIIDNIISISKSFDPTFKINSEYDKIGDRDAQQIFLNGSDEHYDFCKFFEFYVFKTCADFSPLLALGKGGVFRNFDLSVKTFSYSIIEELDDWNHFFHYDRMGITNWLTDEDLQYLYLDKENLKHNGNEPAKAFLSLLEVAHSNELGMIIGVDMREDRLRLLPGHKTVKPEIWTSENSSGLFWDL
ncbi:MAG: hypothetical protein LBE92_17060 [Chryseobacterium sp.]|jgi:hypothetical protein|uniref:hypothetical protein n=1 Tax=Chryseobacterium sp. TaxID=1871047 RepID=UPI00283A0429|nr:hypothetical protein [Chryseobacterium sp.]MDR2237835.1 hypothetical protein [Chryseobacterium sp.]